MGSALAEEPNVDHITNKMGSSIIFGRFMLPDMTEHACQVLDITQQGAIFITSTLPARIPASSPISRSWAASK